MKATEPIVGGPYRRVPRFEEAVGIHRAKKPKAPPIDRSGLMAVHSYELGYLRDPFDRLKQREIEVELHRAIQLHAKKEAW